MLPKFQGFFFLNPFTWVPVGWGYETGWLKWYFIIYLIASIIIAVTLKVREKVVKKGAEKVKIVENIEEEKIVENTDEEKSTENSEEENKGAKNAE